MSQMYFYEESYENILDRLHFLMRYEYMGNNNNEEEKKENKYKITDEDLSQIYCDFDLVRLLCKYEDQIETDEDIDYEDNDDDDVHLTNVIFALKQIILLDKQIKKHKIHGMSFTNLGVFSNIIKSTINMLTDESYFNNDLNLIKVLKKQLCFLKETYYKHVPKIIEAAEKDKNHFILLINNEEDSLYQAITPNDFFSGLYELIDMLNKKAEFIRKVILMFSYAELVIRKCEEMRIDILKKKLDKMSKKVIPLDVINYIFTFINKMT